MATVSIVIPTYNSAQILSDAIDSVRKQTFGDYELIIVDDGSTDNTQDIVSLINDRKIKYVRQDNRGPAASKNRGLSLATGKYVAFLDSDDIWHPDKLKIQIELLETDKTLGMVFCDFNLVDVHRGTSVEMKYSREFSDYAMREILQSCFIRTPSLVVIRNDCFANIGGFDENLWYSDWELYVRIIKKYKIDYVDKTLVDYRISDLGLARNIEKQNIFMIKTLDKIWSDTSITSSYFGIKKQIYFKATFYLGVRNFEKFEWPLARSFFIKSLRYKALNFETYLYLLKSLLGKHVYIFLKRTTKH